MVSFVSCRNFMTRLFCCMNVYGHGINVFIDAIFQIVIFVSRLK